jgi:FMN reductase
VYASNTDFDGYEVAAPALQSRINLAAERALPLVGYAPVADPRALAAF